MNQADQDRKAMQSPSRIAQAKSKPWGDGGQQTPDHGSQRDMSQPRGTLRRRGPAEGTEEGVHSVEHLELGEATETDKYPNASPTSSLRYGLSHPSQSARRPVGDVQRKYTARVNQNVETILGVNNNMLADEDEFRQQIEKETLEKILNQEIVEFDDDDNELRGAGTGDQSSQSPALHQRKMGPYPGNSRLDATKIEEEQTRINEEIEAAKKRKLAAPRYMQPTVEAQMKDVRFQKDLASAGKPEGRTDFPQYYYSRGDQAQAVEPNQNFVVLPQSQMVNHDNMDHLAVGSAKNNHQANMMPYAGRPKDLSYGNLSRKVSTKHDESGNVVTNKDETLSHAVDGASGEGDKSFTRSYRPVQQAQNLKVVQRFNQQRTASNEGREYRKKVELTNLGSDTQSPEARPLDQQETLKEMNAFNYEITHLEDWHQADAELPTGKTNTGISEYHHTIDQARPTNYMGNQSNFAMPPNKFYKRQAKQFNQQTKKQLDFSKQKGVTMYVGIINDTKKPAKEQTIANQILNDVNSKELLNALGEGSNDFVEDERGRGYERQGSQHLLNVSNDSFQQQRHRRAPLVTEGQHTASALSRQLRDSKESSTVRNRQELQAIHQGGQHRELIEVKKRNRNQDLTPENTDEDKTRIKDDNYVDITYSDKELTTLQRTLPLSVVGDDEHNMRQVRPAKSRFRKHAMSKDRKSNKSLVSPTSTRRSKSLVSGEMAQAQSRGGIDTTMTQPKRPHHQGIQQQSPLKTMAQTMDTMSLMKNKEAEEKEVKLKSKKLTGMQDQIKEMALRTMTPIAKLAKLDFRHMDARGTIERHNVFRMSEAKASLKRQNSQSKAKYNSASPARFKSGFKSCNPSLRIIKHKNNSGNLEDAFTMTTQIISGHNTPLACMRLKREKFLNQIEKDQEELLEQLKAKDRKLALKNLKATRIYDDFLTSLEQHVPDVEDEDQQRAIQDERKRQWRKFKPLHQTQSFHTWRSEIQKSIDDGFTFSEVDSTHKVPRRFDKHLTQTKKRRSEALDLEEDESSCSSYENERFSDYKPKSNRSGEKENNSQRRLLSSSSPKKSAKELHRKELLKKKSVELSKKEQGELRILQLQHQEQRMDRKMEKEIKSFFLRDTVQKDSEQHESRSVLLQQVRMRLKMKMLKQQTQRMCSDGQKHPDNKMVHDDSELRLHGQGSITLREYDSDHAGSKEVLPTSEYLARKQREVRGQVKEHGKDDADLGDVFHGAREEEQSPAADREKQPAMSGSGSRGALTKENGALGKGDQTPNKHSSRAKRGANIHLNQNKEQQNQDYIEDESRFKTIQPTCGQTNMSPSNDGRKQLPSTTAQSTSHNYNLNTRSGENIINIGARGTRNAEHNLNTIQYHDTHEGTYSTALGGGRARRRNKDMKSQGQITTAQNVDYDAGSQPGSLATAAEGQSHQMVQPASLNTMTLASNPAKRTKPKTATRRQQQSSQSNMLQFANNRMQQKRMFITSDHSTKTLQGLLDDNQIFRENSSNSLPFSSTTELIRYATVFRYFKMHRLEEIARCREGLKIGFKDIDQYHFRMPVGLVMPYLDWKLRFYEAIGHPFAYLGHRLGIDYQRYSRKRARASIFNYIGQSFLGICSIYPILQRVTFLQRQKDQDDQSRGNAFGDSTQLLPPHFAVSGGKQHPSRQALPYAQGHLLNTRQGLRTAIRRRGDQRGADDGRSAKTSLHNARGAAGNLATLGGGRYVNPSAKQLMAETTRMMKTGQYEQGQHTEAPVIGVRESLEQKNEDFEDEESNALQLESRATSLWKKQFNVRKEMGYDAYNQLSRVQKAKLNNDIRQQFQLGGWPPSPSTQVLGKGQNQMLYKSQASTKFQSTEQVVQASNYSKQLESVASIPPDELVQAPAAVPQKSRVKSALPSMMTMQQRHRGLQQAQQMYQDQVHQPADQQQFGILSHQSSLPATSLFEHQKKTGASTKFRQRKGTQDIDHLLGVSRDGDKTERPRRRTIKPFSDIKMHSTIPADLTGRFRVLTQGLDNAQQQQIDYIHDNRQMVKDPENIKLSQGARLIHEFRTERGGPESMKQCRCRNDDYQTHGKDKYSLKGYEGVVKMNQNNYLEFNSRPYNSIEAQSDLRMKPQSQVDRTNNMTKYFKKEQGEKMRAQRENGKGSQEHEDIEDHASNAFLTALSLDDYDRYNEIQTEVKDLLSGKLAGRNRQNLEKTQQLSGLCTLIDSCHGLHKEYLRDRDHPKSLYNESIKELVGMEDNMGKLGQAVGKYVDMEKVQQENMKNEREATERQLQLAKDQMATQQLAKERTRPLSQRKAPSAQDLEAAVALSETQAAAQIPPKKENSEERLLSLRDIYYDMVRNQELDYQNFMEPGIIGQCIDQKNKSSLYVLEKYKRKIWKPTYAQVIPEPVRTACDFD